MWSRKVLLRMSKEELIDLIEEMKVSHQELASQKFEESFFAKEILPQWESHMKDQLERFSRKVNELNIPCASE